MGLTFGDKLGAFDWICTTDGARVTFYSRGLAANAGLADLLDADRWKPNSFRVRIDDELRFVTPERLRPWGRDHGSLASQAIGRCLPGETCRVWDYSLAPTDGVLRDAAGMDTANTPFMSGASCPVAVHGDRAMSNTRGDCYPEWRGSCGRTYLLDARELIDDYIGNDDGLCESNEACLYAPHFGSSQGSGKLVGPCVFTDGAVTGVTMYAHETR